MRLVPYIFGLLLVALLLAPLVARADTERGRCVQVDPASLIWTEQGWTLAVGDGHATVQRSRVHYWEGPLAYCIPPAGMPTLWIPSSGWLQFAHGDASWIERGAYYIIGSNPRVHCCGIDHCTRLSRDEVMSLGNRYKIGSLRRGLYAEWPADKTFASENEHFWVCHDGPRIRCFFAPAGG